MGRKENYRLYGSIKGLRDKDAKRLASELPLDEVKFADGELDFEHEGPFVDMDTVLELIASALTPEATGQFDHIDNEQWVLTRYSVDGTTLSTKRVGLNDALDKYIYE
jgi:hypothetical protein